MEHQIDFIEKQISWKWCLLGISGNATIVKIRRNDFVKYLKMNVASLIGSEYDFVRVTSISYTPQVLVNVSLHWNEDTEPKIIKKSTNQTTCSAEGYPPPRISWLRLPEIGQRVFKMRVRFRWESGNNIRAKGHVRAQL